MCNSGIFALYVIAVLLLNFSHTGLNATGKQFLSPPVSIAFGKLVFGPALGPKNLLPAAWNTPKNQKFPKFPHFSKVENALKGFSKAKRVEKKVIFLGVRTLR